MQGRIFLSYRRGDDPGFAGRLFDQLQNAFEPEQLFMDVDSIQPGDDFVAVLEEQIAKCDVLLAVIGRNWLAAAGPEGPRLHEPQDFVRIEIATALRLGKLVVPVLVNGAQMPPADRLPDDLQALVRRQASKLGHERFRAETQAMIAALGTAISQVAAKRPVEPTPRTKPEQADAIQLAAEQASWNAARGSGAEADLRAHLRAYPAAATAAAARASLDARVWERVGPTRSEKPMLDYLDEFPDGAHASDARSRLRRMRSEKISELMADTKESASVSSYFFGLMVVVFVGVLAAVYAFLSLSKGHMNQFWMALAGAAVAGAIFYKAM